MADVEEVVNLTKQLNQLVSVDTAVNYENMYEVKKLFMRVLVLCHHETDLKMLLPAAVKLLVHPDLSIRKVSSEILIVCGQQDPDTTMLAINTLVYYCENSNPMVRGWALRTFSSLNVEFVAELLESRVLRGLSDHSAYVRRAAVLACLRLHSTSVYNSKESGIMDHLYRMIRDDDPVVVVNTLNVLDELLHDEGGVVINKAIANYLISRHSSLGTWPLCRVLHFLLKYTPTDDDEMFSFTNVLDHYVSTNCCALSVACVQLLLHLLQHTPDSQIQLYARCGQSLLNHMSMCNAECTYAIAGIMAVVPHRALVPLCSRFRDFFCKNSDPIYLKLTKLNLLQLFITEDNSGSVLHHLSQNCVSNISAISSASIRTLGSICKQHDLSEACLHIFENLLIHSICVFSNIVMTLQDLTIQNERFLKKLAFQIYQNFDKIKTEPPKAAMLHLMEEHFPHKSETLRTIKGCVERYNDLCGHVLKIQLLNTSTNIFLQHPCEMQLLLGNLMEKAVDDVDYEVRCRAKFLYRLLESDVDMAKSILLSDKVMIYV